jgi:hypothetical protein
MGLQQDKDLRHNKMSDSTAQRIAFVQLDPRDSGNKNYSFPLILSVGKICRWDREPGLAAVSDKAIQLSRAR